MTKPSIHTEPKNTAYILDILTLKKAQVSSARATGRAGHRACAAQASDCLVKQDARTLIIAALCA